MFVATSEEKTVAKTSPSPLKRERQAALYRRALESMPGGTDSNFRAWGEDTIYVDRGKGGMVWDVDGNEYIDLRMGYGPVILGHGAGGVLAKNRLVRELVTRSATARSQRVAALDDKAGFDTVELQAVVKLVAG